MLSATLRNCHIQCKGAGMTGLIQHIEELEYLEGMLINTFLCEETLLCPPA